MQRVPEGSEVVRVPVNERLNEKQIKAPDVRYRERILSEGILALIAEVEASRAENEAVCDKYGLPHDYPTLRKHLDANHAVTTGAYRGTIEKLRAENEALRKALENYMSQFGQALDANGIAYGPAQQAADADARAALSPANVTHSQSTCPGVSKCSCFCHEWGGAHPGQKYTGSSEWDAADATHEQEASDD